MSRVYGGIKKYEWFFNIDEELQKNWIWHTESLLPISDGIATDISVIYIMYAFKAIIGFIWMSM